MPSAYSSGMFVQDVVLGEVCETRTRAASDCIMWTRVEAFCKLTLLSCIRETDALTICGQSGFPIQDIYYVKYFTIKSNNAKNFSGQSPVMTIDAEQLC